MKIRAMKFVVCVILMQICLPFLADGSSDGSDEGVVSMPTEDEKKEIEKLLGEAQTSWSKVIDTCKANLLKLQQEISTLADRSFTLWQSSGKDEKAGKLVDIVEKYGIQKKELFEKHAGIIYRLQTAKSGMENNPDSKQMGNIKKLVEEAQTNINNFGGMNVDCVKSVEALSNALSNAKIPAELDKLELKEEEEREEINRLSNIQI